MSVITLLMLTLNVAGLQAAPPAQPADGARVVTRFMDHLATLPEGGQARMAQIRALRQQDSAAPPTEFLPAALALLEPEFAAALQAFDDRNATDAAERFAKLRGHGDPYVAVNAAYFHVRALLDVGLSEEAEIQLEALTADGARLTELTPFASHAFFLLGVTRAADLRYSAASDAIRRVAQDFADAPEAVRIGAHQLALELERREVGTLGEVSDYMSYLAKRLAANDREERLASRSVETVALLDKLIDDAQQREQQQKQNRSSSRGGGGKAPQGAPRADGRDVSEAPAGGGKIGDLHGVDKADPGAAWGKLPPAEREKVLQSLRNRFPSRYRELVEQYYRSLAEEK